MQIVTGFIVLPTSFKAQRALWHARPEGLLVTGTWALETVRRAWEMAGMRPWYSLGTPRAPGGAASQACTNPPPARSRCAQYPRPAPTSTSGERAASARSAALPRRTGILFGSCLGRHGHQPRGALQASMLPRWDACQTATRGQVLAEQRARKKPCAGRAEVTCWAARRRRSGTHAPTPATPAALDMPATAAAHRSRLRHPPFGAPWGRPHSAVGRLCRRSGCR